MCPVCLTTAALAVAGATSAGGVTTVVVKRLRVTKRRKLTTKSKGDQNGPSKNRVTK